MKLVKYDINKMDNADGYRKSDNDKILEEFVESGMDCAKVEGFLHTTSMSCASSLNNSIKRYHIGGVRAVSRKGECFLIKVA